MYVVICFYIYLVLCSRLAMKLGHWVTR